MKYNVDKLIDEILSRKYNKSTSKPKEIDKDELLNEYLKCKIPNFNGIKIGSLGYVYVQIRSSDFLQCSFDYDVFVTSNCHNSGLKYLCKSKDESLFDCFINTCTWRKKLYIKKDGDFFPIFDHSITLKKMQEVIDLYNSSHHRKFDFC